MFASGAGALLLKPRVFKRRHYFGEKKKGRSEDVHACVLIHGVLLLLTVAASCLQQYATRVCMNSGVTVVTESRMPVSCISAIVQCMRLS